VDRENSHSVRGEKTMGGFVVDLAGHKEQGEDFRSVDNREGCGIEIED
jgi:hypothetical protein